MKKSISMLLFVLFSFVSKSQEFLLSVDGAKNKAMSTKRNNSSYVDIIYVKNNSIVTTFSCNQNAICEIRQIMPNVTLNTYTLNNSNQYSFTMTAVPGTTFYIHDISDPNGTGWYFTYVNFNFTPTITSNNNTVSFVSDTLNLNYNLGPNKSIKGVYEYSVSQSSIHPVSGSTLSVPNINQPYTTSGVYYIHLRAWNDYSDRNEISNHYLNFTGWYTYSVNLTYVPTVTTSISEVDKVTDFKLYPNPAKDVITVEYSSKNNIDHVSLYTITGQEVSTTAVESMGNNTLTFNVESYPAGIYFVRIGTASYKFIKQ